MGGSSKKVTVGYKYYAGMHLVLCHGVADKLIRIQVDDRDAWYGEADDESITIDKPNLFGGESREGGIKGTVDVQMGKNTQMPNSYLVSKLGSLVPAFRGVVGVVLRQVYMGLNPYLKNWNFRVQRIHRRYDDQVQWYDEKAEINPYASAILNDPWQYQVLPFHSDPGYNQLTLPTSGWEGEGYLPFTSSYIWLYPTPPGWPTTDLSVIWIRKTVYNVPAGLTIQARADNGCVMWVNGVYVGASNRDNIDISNNSQYPVNFVVPATGTYEIYVKAFSEETAATQGGNSISITLDTIPAGAMMNPAHIIRECLTDPDWGMGYQDADIDDASFIAAADRLYDEGMGMCILWDTQTAIEEFVKEIVRHIDAALFIDRQTGKFFLKLIRDDFDEGSLLVLNEDNIDKISDLKRPSFGELINAVTVTYWDLQTGEESTITVADIALAQQQGNTNLSSIKYPGFVTGELASRVAQRDLKQLSTPLVSCTIYANLDAEDLNIGSVFKLTWPDFDINELVMRVTGIAYGDGKTNRVRIQCAQDVFALPDTAFIPETPPVWVDPSSDPVPVVDQLAFEVPYLELVQIQGQTTVDSLLLANPDAGYVSAAAVRPIPAALYTRLFTDSGAGFEEAGQVDFSPSATLVASINRVQETFDVENRQDFDEIVIGSWFQLNDEIMGYLGISGDTVTVQRGCLDTVPAEHTAGDPLIFWDYYADGDPTEYVASDDVDVRLCTVTGSGQLALADAQNSNVILNSRAVRPYAPGNVKANGEYFPASLAVGDTVVTWAHRDRLQQTAAALNDFFDGNIGPETDTTYELNIYDEDGVLLRTYSGISGTTQTYTNAQELIDFVKAVYAGNGIYTEISPGGVVIPGGVTAFWPADGLSGSSLPDASGNGYDATASNLTEQAGFNESTSSLFMNGAVTQYLSMPNAVFTGSTNLVISFWLRMAQWNSSTSAFISLGSSAYSYNDFLLYLSTSHQVALLDRNNATFGSNGTGPVIPPMCPIHIAVKREVIGSNIYDKFYLNGVLIFTSAALPNSPLTVDSGCAIFGHDQDSAGGGFQNTQSLIGNYSKLRAYRSNLSDSEIKSLFDEFKASPSPQAYVRYTMDAVSGSTLTDAQGNVNGTLVGGVAQNGDAIIGDYSLDFNGSTGYVTLNGAAAAIEAADSMAISLWVKTTDTSGPYIYSHILFSLHTSTGGNVFRVGIAQNGNLYVGANNTISDASNNVGVTLNDGNWHHLVVVLSQTSCYVWADKILTNIPLISENVGWYSGVVAARASLGQEWDTNTPSDFYDGLIDDFHLFVNRIPNAAEVEYLYEQGVPPAVEGLENRLSGELNLKLKSTRDGYDSYQQHDFSFNRSGYGYGYGLNYGE